jgi:hypothetical protein
VTDLRRVIEKWERDADQLRAMAEEAAAIAAPAGESKVRQLLEDSAETLRATARHESAKAAEISQRLDEQEI